MSSLHTQISCATLWLLIASCGPADPGQTGDRSDADVTDDPSQEAEDNAMEPSTDSLGDLDPDDPDEQPDCIASAAPNRIHECDLLIITPAELAPYWEPLVSWRTRRGVPAAILTLEQIDEQQPGEDTPARIREAIRHAYQEHGTRWFLLGADTPLIPHRDIHLTAYNEAESAHLDDIIASELYYSDLDGDWDGDEDGVLAELEDGLDMMPDVFVGRVPVRNGTEVGRWLDKLMAYERADRDDYQQRALFLAEVAGTVSGEPICSTIAFETFIDRLFPTWFDITKLYASQCGEFPDAEPNTTANQTAAMNLGQNLIINMGHGNWSSLCRLGLAEIAALSNVDRPSVYITTECNGCEFDVTSVDHVACETFLTSPGGGVAYIGNTDFGPGFPCELLFIETWVERLFAHPDETLGEHFAEALRHYVDPEELDRELSDYRWTQATLVLMGDPAMRVWTRTPEQADVVVRTQRDGERVSSQEVTVRTRDGEPIEGALVTIYREEEFLYTVTSDEAGVACVVFPEANRPEPPWWITVTSPRLSNFEYLWP